MAKLPSFAFYPGDWLKDPALRRCSPAARGVWIDMLCLMFESEQRGTLISADRLWSKQELAQVIAGDQNQVLACIDELLANGVASRDKRGAILSRRMVRDEKIRAQRVKAGLLGGRPPTKSKGKAKRKAKQKQIPEYENEDEKENEIPSGKKGGIAQPRLPPKLDTKPFRGAWNDWIQHRREIRKKLTPLAVKMAITKLEKLGHDRAIETIEHSIANGWTGLIEPKRSEGRPTGPSGKVHAKPGKYANIGVSVGAEPVARRQGEDAADNLPGLE